MPDDYENLLLKQNQILAKLNTLAGTAVPGRSGDMLDTFREREYYREFRSDWEKNPELRERFLALVRGLDEESVQTVVRALNRLRKIQHSNERYMDLYTAEEKRAYKEMRDRLAGETIRLAENCWYFNGCMLPVDDFEACVFLDRCGLGYLDHPDTLADKDIIDAGAFIGDSALILSPLTNRRVYAFEPTEDSFGKLQKTIELNGLTNVTACKMGLGEARGSAEMAQSLIPSTNTQVRNSAVPYAGTETVEITTLDDFVKENDLRVGLLKVDVEGAEQMLLRGAMETIRSMKPALLFSIYHNEDDFFHIKPILEEMNLGYRFKIRHPAIGTVLTETMLIAEVPCSEEG